jgi:tetratricopeptide (TPR) repeat protein
MVDRRYEDGPDPHGREWIAMSVTNLLDVYSGRKDQYAWLRERPFTAFPGRSIALFDISGDAVAHRRLGEVALRLGDFETAEPPVRRAVELAPRDSRSRLDLAGVLASRGRFDEALASCAEAERLLSDRETAETCRRILARAEAGGRRTSGP